MLWGPRLAQALPKTPKLSVCSRDVLLEFLREDKTSKGFPEKVLEPWLLPTRGWAAEVPERGARARREPPRLSGLCGAHQALQDADPRQAASSQRLTRARAPRRAATQTESGFPST